MVTPTPTTVQVKFQLRIDTAATWASINPVLLNGEMGLESDTNKVKVGDGTTAWNSLGYFPFVVSGGTVLGNLEIGSTGTLTFEGSTADDYETTLAVTDPTADRTITLPDQSGTVVVSGNASIVDADIAADAEIAVSKLANGTVNQVLVTDGTDVSWSDDLTIAGNLTVNGTTTTVNTETLVVEDKNIELGVVDTPTDTTADGGGITLKGSTNKTINWVDSTDSWTSSENIDLASGKSYSINGTEVLSATTLGSGVTSSSLTSVGTISSGTWQGTAIDAAYLDSTVVTTGDTGTVTSTMIADGTIVDVDVSASAAIAGSKIDPDFGSQTVETTGVFSAAAGSNSAPSITFTGDLNTGIYSPGADQVAISTNGTGRLFVDASGNVGVGAAGNARLQVTGGDLWVDRAYKIYFAAGSAKRAWIGSSANNELAFGTSDGTTDTTSLFLDTANSRLGINDNNPAVTLSVVGKTGIAPFKVNGPSSEFLRITSDGKLGLGTGSPGAPLVVAKDGTTAPTGLTGTATVSSFANTAQNRGLGINYDAANVTAGVFSLGANSKLCFYTPTSATYAERMRIDNQGRVGIGTTTALGKCHVASAAVSGFTGANTAGDELVLENNLNCGMSIIGGSGSTIFFGDGSSNSIGSLIYSHTDDSLRANVNGSEAFRVDSSRRLLVGTSSARQVGASLNASIQVETTNYIGFSTVNNTADSGGTAIVLAKSRGSAIGSNTIVQNGDNLGEILFAGADGTDVQTPGASILAQVDGTPGANDMPGRLVFSTTADGASSPTPRMVIKNNGAILIGYSSVPGGFGAYKSVLLADSSGDGIAFRMQTNGRNACAFTNSGGGLVGSIVPSASSTAYNTSSDYRLKENVTAVTDGIARLQQLKPSRFNFIADPDTTVDGFLAHEVQTIVPEAITGEKDAVDDDGNPVYQGIDQSKLVPLLTAALQEAVAKIESLEARLDAANL